MKRILFAVALLLLGPASAHAHMISPVPYLSDTVIVQAALLRGGVTIATPDPDACGVSTNNWCVMANGWTKFIPKTGNDGLTCTTNTVDTCIIAVSNAGNDTTCALEKASAKGITSSEDLSTFSPTLPCLTPLKARQVSVAAARSGKADWMVLKKSNSWDGGMNGASGGNVQGTGGESNSNLMLITAYGVGARPILRKVVFSTDGLILFNSAAGNYSAVTGLKLYDAVSDPTNATYFNGYTVTGDTTASNAVISNVSPAVNADVIANPSRYSIMGTGLPSTGATIVPIASATSTTITLSGKLAGLSSTGATFQISGTNAQAGIGWGAALNTAIVEDMDLTWSNLSIPYNGVSTTTGLNIRIRRNMISHSWNRQFGGTTYFSAGNPGTPSQTILLEENVQNWGGFYPDLWGGAYFAQTHCMYLHDPSYFTLKKNVTSDCSNTGAQNRDAGTSYNNLWMRSPTLQYANTGRGNTSVSYDVYDSASEYTIGNRTAKATSLCTVSPPTAPCATSIKFEGITAYLGLSGAGMNNTNLVNLDNPGSVVGRTLYSNVTAYDTITLSTDGSGTSPGIYAGIRGDGVRSGDRLRSVVNSGIALEHARGGFYFSPGVATGTVYAGPTTVSVSNGTPILVTEATGAAATRPIDEPFKFISGTLPTPLTTTDTYCTVAQGSAYNIYPATAGPTINGATSYTCPGVSGNTIDATGGSTAPSIPRTGSRKWLFNNATNPYTTAVPTWLAQGMSILSPNVPTLFTGTNSWVASVAADRQSFLTTDSSVTGVATGSAYMMFDAPNTTNTPTVRLGPNNIFTRCLQRGSGGFQAAIILDNFDFAVDASSNYIYNCNGTSANNLLNNAAQGWTGNGLTPANFTSSNTISSASQVLNAANSTTYPNANVPAYDASVGGRTVTGTFAANGFGGSIFTVATGNGVIVQDDFPFDNSGSNPIDQYSKFIYKLSSSPETWLVENNTQTIGTPFSIKLGSHEHFMANALNQSKDAGWNTTYTANAANNFIRNAIGCTAASTPACPAQ